MTEQEKIDLIQFVWKEYNGMDLSIEDAESILNDFNKL